ncbi:MAG: hypothetical protein U1A77_02445 [Pirellulales bacterium]|jgi:hypothetical protein
MFGLGIIEILILAALFGGAAIGSVFFFTTVAMRNRRPPGE